VPRGDEETAAPTRGGSVPGRLSELIAELAREPGAETGAAWDRALFPGALIGRFELVREVGRGGFGVVYEARDTQLGRTVAFKAVRAGGQLDVREERLLREAEAAARLSHPNIVTLFDVGRSERGPYLVLEFLRGETLARRLEQGPIPLAEALRVATEVAKGVAHAHVHGVVHRDLTPGNVFLCDDGQVKVLDLGMAHAFGHRRVSGGTPGYMAPEQERGAPEDERTDVFALGAILRRMLSGDPPFANASGARPAPPLDVPGMSALGDLVARMLEEDPVERPRDAREVLGVLGTLQRELERAPALGSSLARPRRRWLWRAAALVGLGAERAPAQASSRARLRRRRRLRVAALVGLGVALGAGVAAGVQRWSHGSAPASIAVLPFADLSPAKDQEYFSDGLADEILSALGSVDGLRVPSRTSSFSFKGKGATLSDIGRTLHVDAVLEGSVRRAGSRVRVTAQLVSVADGYRQWSETYDRELTDIFAVQDEIARSVVRALHAKAPAAKAPQERGRETKDPEVYREYLLGRHYAYQFTPESLRLAAEAYERALARDPSYAPAWAGLAYTVYHRSDDAPTHAAVMAQRQRARAAAERAVQLAPALAEAVSVRGYLRAFVDYDWAGAQADLDHALKMNPNDADAHRRQASLLAAFGRTKEAIAEARKLVDLDPLGGSSWTKLGLLQQLAGELDGADAAFRRDLERWPGSTPALVGLGRNLLLRSKPADALAVFARCPEDYAMWGTAVAQHALGHGDASRAALRTLTDRYAHTRAFDIGEIHAWRGEKEAAFEWLERAYEQHEGGLAAIVKTDPFLRSLRGDPRHAALLRKMKLPVE
jgi:TolB-like protein